MIFNKKFEDITFEDIQALKDNRVAESEFLDYKRQFDKDEAAKLISALANTYGGFIVYGIATDDKSNVPKEIVGVEEKRLEDRLDSVCYDKISPPVFCQSNYLEDSERGLSVFLVRVPESDLTPHGIDNNTQWYVKVKGQKRPYARADFDRLEWLRERRKKQIEFRNMLLRRATERADGRTEGVKPHEYVVESVVVAQFPRQPLVQFDQLYEFISRGFERFFSKFHWNYEGQTLASLNDGIYIYNAVPALRYYIEFNSYGLCLARHYLTKSSDNDGREQYVSPLEVGTWTFFGLMFAVELLEHAGFRGSLITKLSLSNIGRTRLSGASDYGRRLRGEVLYPGIEDPLCLHDTWSRFHHRRELIDFAQEFWARLFFLYGARENARERSKQLYDVVLQQAHVDPTVALGEIGHRQPAPPT